MRTCFDAILIVFLLCLVVHAARQDRRIKQLERKAALAEGTDEVFWKVTDRFYKLEASLGK